MLLHLHKCGVPQLWIRWNRVTRVSNTLAAVQKRRDSKCMAKYSKFTETKRVYIEERCNI